MNSIQEMDVLFPLTVKREEFEIEEDAASRRNGEHGHEVSFLWSQLHHLGNLGFDPGQFRIDPYGNVLYWSADPSSPLAWEVDHWFPSSRRGDKRVMGNVRLVQWQVAQLKQEKLEFLMPSWDLQVGISVNQFLVIYSSKNADFRKRAFALLFLNNDADDAHQQHIWPLHFKQRYGKETVKGKENKDPGASLKWPNIEKQALGDHVENVAQIMEKKPIRNPYTCEMKDRILHELAEELVQSYTLLSSSIEQQSETGRELSLEVERKKDQVLLMEKELKRTRHQNERERLALRELESTLEKHKQQLEKQQHWTEMQSQYRECLERILRDTLHQSLIFREKARLNEAACDSLLVQIQSHKMSCKKAELDLIERLKQRQDLELERVIHEGFGSLKHDMDKKESVMNVQEIVMDQQESLIDENQNMVSDKVLCLDDVGSNSASMKDEEKHVHEDKTQMRTTKRYTDTIGTQSRPSLMWMDTIIEEDEDREAKESESESESQRSPLKGQCAEKIILPNGYQDQNHSETNTSEEEKQLNKLLQEVLTLEGQPYDAPPHTFNPLESEEDRKTRLGKLNVDKWLQRLLLNSGSDAEKNVGKLGNHHDKQSANKDGCTIEKQEVSNNSTNFTRNEDKSRKVLDGLFRMMSFRHEEKTLKNDAAPACEGFVKRRREDMRDCEKKRKHRIKHLVHSQSQFQSQPQLPSPLQSQSQSQSQSLLQSCDPHHQDGEDTSNCSNSIDSISFSSGIIPPYSNVVKRSYSMSSTSDPWIQQTRSGSESTTSIFVFEEDESVNEGLEAIFHDGYNNKNIGGGTGLKASLRTSCKKAWNRARSRREIQSTTK